MPVDVVLGLQWGDEGKGKIVDLLSEDADIVARYQGGPNAGHTVIKKGQKYVLHMVPAGIIHEKRCLIGSGCVVDPGQMFNEFVSLRNLGLDPRELVGIDLETTLITPEMRLMDALQEMGTGHGFGSTMTGIAFAYAAAARKKAVTVRDICDDSRIKILEEKVNLLVDEAEAVIVNAWRTDINVIKHACEAISDRDRNTYENLIIVTKTPNDLGIRENHLRFMRFFDLMSEDRILDRKAIIEYLTKMGDKLVEYGAVTDVFQEVQDVVNKGGHVIAEGGQGMMLHLLQGTRPYTTSSYTGVDGAMASLGFTHHQIGHVVGVLKAYVTRVGKGPMPTEDSAELGQLLQEQGHEFGATTGRARRCGLFDVMQASYALRRTGVDHLAITKLDILAEIPKLRLGIAYKLGHNRLKEFPRDGSVLEAVQPIWSKPLPSFASDEVHGVNDWNALGPNAKAYAQSLFEAIRPTCPDMMLKYIGTGPGREDIIIVPDA